MKFLKLSILTTVFSICVLACNKDSDGTASQPIAGKWVGTYGFGNESPAIYYAFNIKSNGVIEELSQSGNSKGSGTWNLNGNTFTAHYQWKAPLNTIYTVIATYDVATGKLTGTWGYDDDGDNGGLWEQSKQ
ncbi:MAG: hypothetical protein H7Y42_05500 [Chitinophagaceae bacterium]|nr:hypothetical protein [Chitinophagaceae bacterium]